MPPSQVKIVLATASETRAAMFRNAGLTVGVRPARIDEDLVRASLEAEGLQPRDIADALAEMKALKIAADDAALVIGADQILSLDGKVLGKAGAPAMAEEQLAALSGKTHRLYSAAVVQQGGKPIWRHVSEARITFHALMRDEIAGYVARHWDSIRHSVGCYRIEAEGVRLIARADGDYFTILGFPMIPLLTWLRQRGDIGA